MAFMGYSRIRSLWKSSKMALRANSEKSARKAATRSIAPGAVSHADEAAATHIGASSYARERYEFLLRVLFVLLGLLAVSIAGNIFMGLQETSYRYFATDARGSVIELQPLERPVQSIEEVNVWAAKAVTAAFTLDFANYRQRLTEIRPYFTDAGWKGYQTAIDGQGILQSITQNKIVVTAVPSQSPVVTATGVVDGVYGWKIEIPIIVTYETATAGGSAGRGRSSNNMIIQITVVRRPVTENPQGLGIAQMVAR